MKRPICLFAAGILLTAAAYASAQSTLPAVDATVKTPPEKTTFELEVVKVLLGDEHMDGVDWEGIMADYTPLYLDHQRWLGAGSLSTIDHGTLQEALATIGEVQTYRSPDMAVGYGEEALVNLTVKGVQTMVAVSVPSQPAARDQIPLQDGADIDMSFAVVPYHNDDETFDIEIRTLSDDIKDKTVQLRIHQSDVIVIGGLFQEQKVPGTNKVPFFGDIPFLGAVFRSRTSDVLKNEVIVFLRPAKPVLIER